MARVAVREREAAERREMRELIRWAVAAEVRGALLRRAVIDGALAALGFAGLGVLWYVWYLTRM